MSYYGHQAERRSLRAALLDLSATRNEEGPALRLVATNKSFPLNTMNNQTHPIELFIASLLNLLEFICYIINEIAGHHQTATNIVSGDQTTTPTTTSQASAIIPTQPHTNPLFTTLQSLTVKQLQATTGIRSSRYRKSDLIALAAAY